MQNIVLPMEEVNGNLPFIAITAAMHGLNHLRSTSMLSGDLMQGIWSIALYIVLGEKRAFLILLPLT